MKQEEGKITTISEGVRAGTVVKCDNSDEKIQNVAKNVANYIALEQAGHFKYGVCYIFAQVRAKVFYLRSSLDWLNFDFLYALFVQRSIFAPSTAFYL